MPVPIRVSAILLLLTCCSGFSAAQDPSTVRAEIESRLARHAVALAASDVPTALTLYTDDAIVRPANMEPVAGKEALKTGFTQWFAAMAVKDVKYSTIEFDVCGDKAYQLGTYTGTQQPPGQAGVPDRGSFTIVWKRQTDGTWRYHRGIFNSSLPAAETITRKK